MPPLRWRVASLALASLLGAPAGADCGDAIGGPARLRIDGDAHVVVFAPLPPQWRSGRHFSLDIALCLRDAAAAPISLRVDAVMPEHRHGMNYAVTVRPLGGGRYRADGLMFHMPGRWRVQFEIAGADGRLRTLTRDIEVP